MITFKIAFRNVWKNWRQSVASVVSVSAAFLTLALFQGYLLDVEGLFSSIYRHRTMFGDAMVEHRDLYSPEGRSEPWKHLIDSKSQKFIQDFVERNSDLVTTRVRFLKTSGLATNGKTSVIFAGVGYDLAEGLQMRGSRWGWNALYGQTLEASQNSAGIVIGQTMATLFGCQPLAKRTVSSLLDPAEGKKIGFSCEGDQTSLQLSGATQDGQLNAIDSQIVGFVDGGFKDIDGRYVMMSLENAQILAGTSGVTYETFLLKSPNLAKEFNEKFQKEADALNLPLKFQTWKVHPYYGDAFIRSMELLALFRNFVVVIVLTIATLSVLNTLIKVVNERTREIGTLRSLGYRKFQISQIFVFEAAGLALLGNGVGILGAIIISLMINHSGLVYKAGMFVEPAPLTVAIDLKIYLASFLYLSMLAVLAALVALRLTLKRKVSENLCYA
jgi:putative ABC transport system permease protein